MKTPYAQTRARAAEAFAPGTVGNVGPGLDILGLAISGAGDTVRVEPATDPGIVLEDPGHADLPANPARHAAAIAAHAVLQRAGAEDLGVRMWVSKGLPLSAGQGGSAASAVAGAGAVNAMLGEPLSRIELVAAALEAETIVAGRHLDNVAPAVLGGLVLIRSVDPLDLVRLPVPGNLHLALVHPEMSLRTVDGRRALPREVSLEDALHQAAQVGAQVAAAASGDLALFGRAIDDRVAEPARAPLLPGFTEAKRAALDAGALGCSISGSGPTAFAIADSEDTARSVAAAMRKAYQAAGQFATWRVAVPDFEGLRVRTE